jgi:small subunit ribosomal protein S16
MVKIRFSTKGRKHQIYYSIVVVDSRKPRDSGDFLEVVGSYNPRSKETKLNKEGIEKWIKNGAQPTLTVKNLFKKNNLFI